MSIQEAISQLTRCETCERVRYPEKFCGECMFNARLKDNYKIDRNVDNLVRAEADGYEDTNQLTLDL